MGRHLIYNIIFYGMINVLANKFVMTPGCTLRSISVMISSLNDYVEATFKLYGKPVSRTLPHVQLK